MNLSSIFFQQELQENFNYKINFRCTLKLPKIIRKSTFIINKLK